jgi:hypothetical protein
MFRFFYAIRFVLLIFPFLFGYNTTSFYIQYTKFLHFSIFALSYVSFAKLLEHGNSSPFLTLGRFLQA